MIDRINRLRERYGDSCNPYWDIVGVLCDSSCVKDEEFFWFGKWVGRRFVFVEPVSLMFDIYRWDGRTVLSFGDVVCLCVVVVLNNFVECKVVSASGVDCFYLLNDVFKVGFEVK